MRPDIHPSYEALAITCSCGHQFETRSTRLGQMAIEVCSQCHPFYTGKQKIVDTAGRVENFMKRFKEVKPVVKAAEPAPAAKKPAVKKVAVTKKADKKTDGEVK